MEQCNVSEGQGSDGDFDQIIRVKMNKKRVINACVEMVTTNGLPFCAMEHSGFVKILQPIIDGLAAKNEPFTINRTNIKTHVQNKADDMVRGIKKEVNGRFVSVMMDMATRHSRSILGISIQYMLNDDIVVRTLAMDFITSRHTGAEIKKRLLAVLDKYGIQTNQIFAMTTDNGSNMTKTIELINEAEMQPIEPSRRIYIMVNLLDQPLAAIENGKDGCDVESEDEDELEEDQRIAEAERELQEMRSTVDVIFLDETILRLTNAISCAIHTMQLGMVNAFKDSDFKDGKLLMEKCAKLVTALRTPAVLRIIDREKYMRPVKRVKTRWNTDLSMVCYFRKIYHFFCGLISE